MFLPKKCLYENTLIPQGMWNSLLVSVTLLRPIFHIWKSLRLFFLLLCLFLCGSQQFSEAPVEQVRNEHEEKSPFPLCQQFTERKSNHMPQTALDPSLLSTSENLSAPHFLPMLRKVLEQGGKSHSFVHQKFKGTIYALNLSYICLYHCFKFMTIWISCILPLSRQIWLHKRAAGGWPWGWVQSALGTLQSPLTDVCSFCVEQEVFLWSNCPSIRAG